MSNKAELKLNAGSLSGVEVLYEGKFRPSNWGGKTWEVKAADIDAIIEATAAYLADTGNGPVAKLDHKDAQPLGDILGSVNLGQAVNMRAVTTQKGDAVVRTLVVDFEGMPAAFRDMVTNGLASRRSVEVRFREGYGPVLEAVAFFGVGTPAVPALNKLEKELLAARESTSSPGYSPALPDNGTVVVILDEYEEENREVSSVDDTKELEALRAENAELREQLSEVAKLKEAEAGAVAKCAELEYCLAEKDKTISVFLAEKEAGLIAELEAFVSSLIESGRVAPARKEATLAALKALDGDARDGLKVTLSELPQDSRITGEALPASATIAPLDYKAWLKENSLEDSFDNYRAAIRAGVVKGEE